MSVLDKERLFSGDAAFPGGMNGALLPSMLPGGGVTRARNATFRRGVARHRPGLRNLALNAADGATVQAFEDGAFMGAALYQSLRRASWIIAVVSGRIFRLKINPGDAFIDEIPITLTVVGEAPAAFPGTPDAPGMIYFCQADRWLVMQNGSTPPVILTINGAGVPAATHSFYDPASADPNNGVPIGGPMAYGQGRLFVAGTGDNDRLIYASDLWNTLNTATPPAGRGKAVVRFTEIGSLNEGQPFTATAAFGPIQALAFLTQEDTATGQGQLYSFSLSGANAYNVAAARPTWKDIAFQSIALQSAGVVGHRTLTLVNEDAWYRSTDGVRSFRQARAERTGWTHLPQSLPVREWVDADNPDLLFYGSAIAFDNRLIFTTGPGSATVAGTANRWIHSGLLALNFDPLSTGLGVASPAPIWEGRWDLPNVRFTQLVKTRTWAAGSIASNFERAFVFSLNALDKNILVEITRAERTDNNGAPIAWEVETRGHAFGTPYGDKTLTEGDAGLRDRLGDTTFAVDLRPDGCVDWIEWLAPKTQNAPLDSPPRYTPRFKFGEPPDVSLAAAGRRSTDFFDVQVRFRFTGSLELARYRLHAFPAEEPTGGGGSGVPP